MGIELWIIDKFFYFCRLTILCIVIKGVVCEILSLPRTRLTITIAR